MQRGSRLSYNVRLGTAMMLLGNMLAVTLGTTGDRRKEFVFLVPATLGLGLTNPSILFSFVSLFGHRGRPLGSGDKIERRLLTGKQTKR